MTLQNKILLLFFELSCVVGLSAQTLNGKIISNEDSLPVMFANIAVIDTSGDILTSTTTNEEGEFNVQIPENAYFMRIHQLQDFAELHIINLNHEFSDTLDIGQLTMIKTLPYFLVQYKGITERKERRKQRQLINDYNELIMCYKDEVVEVHKQTVKLTLKPIKQTDSERLKLAYILNFEELNERK